VDCGVSPEVCTKIVTIFGRLSTGASVSRPPWWRTSLLMRRHVVTLQYFAENIYACGSWSAPVQNYILAKHNTTITMTKDSLHNLAAALRWVRASDKTFRIRNEWLFSRAAPSSVENLSPSRIRQDDDWATTENASPAAGIADKPSYCTAS